MKRTLVAIITAVFVLTLLPISAVLADDATEIELLGLEWDHHDLTVSVTLKGRLPDNLPITIQGVLDDWTDELGENFELNVIEDSDADIYITIHPGKYRGVLGMTRWFDENDDQVFDSVTISMKIDNNFAEVDFENILRHEIGHALGLGHTPEEDSDLMDPYYSPGTGDIMPSTLDIDALLHIYLSDGFGGDNIDPTAIPDFYPVP